jgi:hypothetical protein
VSDESSNAFRVLVARLWRRSRAPIAGNGTNRKAEHDAGKAPQNLAGRWPDAASLLAHRMRTLHPKINTSDPSDEKCD